MQQIQNTPKISIITISLNQGRFLREMIESILNQSFKDFEHIVVDGASTDNTLEILKEYYRDTSLIFPPDQAGNMGSIP